MIRRAPLQIVVLLGLGLVAYLTSNAQIDTSPIFPTPMKSLSAISEIPAPASDLLAEIRSDEVLARPLFSPSRRPAAATTAKVINQPEATSEQKPADVEAKSETPDLRLLGIQISVTRSAALLANGQANDAKWYRPGDKIGGSILTKVEKDSVTVRCSAESGEECERTIPLFSWSSGQDG